MGLNLIYVFIGLVYVNVPPRTSSRNWESPFLQEVPWERGCDCAFSYINTQKKNLAHIQQYWLYAWIINHIFYFLECPIRTPSSGVDRGGLGNGHGSRSPVCFVLEEVQEPFVHGTVPWLQTGSNCHRGQRNQPRNQEWTCWGSQRNIDQGRNGRERLELF